MSCWSWTAGGALTPRWSFDKTPHIFFLSFQSVAVIWRRRPCRWQRSEVTRFHQTLRPTNTRFQLWSIHPSGLLLSARRSKGQPGLIPAARGRTRTGIMSCETTFSENYGFKTCVSKFLNYHYRGTHKVTQPFTLTHTLSRYNLSFLESTDI